VPPTGAMQPRPASQPQPQVPSAQAWRGCARAGQGGTDIGGSSREVRVQSTAIPSQQPQSQTIGAGIPPSQPSQPQPMGSGDPSQPPASQQGNTAQQPAGRHGAASTLQHPSVARTGTSQGPAPGQGVYMQAGGLAATSGPQAKLSQTLPSRVGGDSVVAEAANPPRVHRESLPSSRPTPAACPGRSSAQSAAAPPAQPGAHVRMVTPYAGAGSGSMHVPPGAAIGNPGRVQLGSVSRSMVSQPATLPSNVPARRMQSTTAAGGPQWPAEPKLR
jgi:hypothetical protein